jgi:hypothetical protein
VRTLTNDWFNKFGFPQTIHFKEGRVRVSQLAQKINNMAPPMTLTCKNWPTTFNTETKQKWKLTQQHLPEEEFVNAFNFFHNFQNPELGETQISQATNQVTESLPEINKEHGPEKDYNEEECLDEDEDKPYTHRFSGPKRKTIKVYRHKLQHGSQWSQDQNEATSTTRRTQARGTRRSRANP